MDVQIECPCPPKADGAPRHAHDTVTLRDTLGFTAATAIRNTVAFAKAEDPDAGAGELLALLTEGYILHGVSAWTLIDLDDKGRAYPVPVTRPEIRSRLLTDPLAAESVAEAANDLYREAITRPLVQRALNSLQPSPTDEPTSPPETSPRSSTGRASRPKRPKRSLTSITPTGDIEATTGWHGGVSSSSPNSATAA